MTIAPGPIAQFCDTDPHVSFVDVSVSYGSHIVVESVSLAVEPGQSVAITGSNGSGKSSLIRCLLGFAPITAGTTLVNGRPITGRRDWVKRRDLIAYIPQRPPTGRFPITVGELLSSAGHRSPDSNDHITTRAEQLRVSDLLTRCVDELSGGQVQRCFIARALCALDSGAEILVADEPTSALDFDGQDEVSAILTSIAATKILVSHQRGLVERCSRVVEMAGGRIRESPTP